MQHTLCHSLIKQQSTVGMSAYWSLFANINSDRTPETSGVREGAGYA
jgi:hypothetical protein